MFGGGLETIYKALESYGLRRDAAAYAAGEVARGSDEDAEDRGDGQGRSARGGG